MATSSSPTLFSHMAVHCPEERGGGGGDALHHAQTKRGVSTYRFNVEELSDEVRGEAAVWTLLMREQKAHR